MTLFTTAVTNLLTKANLLLTHTHSNAPSGRLHDGRTRARERDRHHRSRVVSRRTQFLRQLSIKATERSPQRHTKCEFTCG